MSDTEAEWGRQRHQADLPYGPGQLALAAPVVTPADALRLAPLTVAARPPIGRPDQAEETR